MDEKTRHDLILGGIAVIAAFLLYQYHESIVAQTPAASQSFYPDDGNAYTTGLAISASLPSVSDLVAGMPGLQAPTIIETTLPQSTVANSLATLAGLESAQNLFPLFGVAVYGGSSAPSGGYTSPGGLTNPTGLPPITTPPPAQSGPAIFNIDVYAQFPADQGGAAYWEGPIQGPLAAAVQRDNPEVQVAGGGRMPILTALSRGYKSGVFIPNYDNLYWQWRVHQ